MTIQEFHQNFKFRLDKLDSIAYPNFLPEEIDLILNQAQNRIVKQRYGTNNIKRKSFEETQKRIEDLKELLRTVVTIPVEPKSDNVSNNAYNVDLQDDHWFTIWEKAIINGPSCNSQIKIPIRNFYSGQSETAPALGGGEDEINQFTIVLGKEVEVRPITHLELDKTLNDAFKAPDKDKILRLMYRNRAELISSSNYTIMRYIYRYIKKPNEMSISNNVNCELSEHLHDEIVDEAVKIALEGIEAKRNNTFTPIIDNQNE